MPKRGKSSDRPTGAVYGALPIKKRSKKPRTLKHATVPTPPSSPPHRSSRQPEVTSCSVKTARLARTKVGLPIVGKYMGKNRSLLHYSPPSSLLANMAVSVSRQKQRPTQSDGATSLKPKSKQTTKKKRSVHGSQDKDVSQVVHACSGRRDELSCPPSDKHPSDRAASCRGGETYAATRPRFQMSTSSNRRRRRGSGKVTSAVEFPPTQDSGNVFLRHLDFKPIQDGPDKRASQSPVIDLANYQSWMQVHASLTSCNKEGEPTPSVGYGLNLGSSVKENLGTESRNKSWDIGDMETSKWKDALEIPIGPNQNNPQASEEASQTCETDFKLTGHTKRSSSGVDHNRPKTHFNNVIRDKSSKELCFQGLCHIGKSGSRISQMSQELLDDNSSHSNHFKSNIIDQDISGDEGEDEELRDTWSDCVSQRKSLSSSPPKSHMTRRRCFTPHVSRTAKVQSSRADYSAPAHRSAPPATQCSGSKSNSSRVESDSSSGTSSKSSLAGAIDDISKERLQYEFDLRLGKYMSILCCQAADSPMSGRLHKRLLKQRQQWASNHSRDTLNNPHRNRLRQSVGSMRYTNRCERNSETDPQTLTKISTPLPRGIGLNPETSQAGGYQTDGYVPVNRSQSNERPPASHRSLSTPADGSRLTFHERRGMTPSWKTFMAGRVGLDKARERYSGTPDLSKITSKSRPVSQGAEGRGAVQSPVRSKPPLWRTASQTVHSNRACRGIRYRASFSRNSSHNLRQAATPTVSDDSMINQTSRPQRLISSQKCSQGINPEASKRPSLPPKPLPHEKVSPRHKNLQSTIFETSEDTSRDIPTQPSSCVEEDLRRYNAVMTRCRALLGEHEEEEESSSWTHISDLSNVETLAKSCGPKPPGITVPCRPTPKPQDRSMGDAAGIEQQSGVPPPGITQNIDFAPRTRSSHIRLSSSFSGQESCQPFPVEDITRPASNPFYVDMVKFDNAEAIKQLLDSKYQSHPCDGPGKDARPSSSHDSDRGRKSVCCYSAGLDCKEVKSPEPFSIPVISKGPGGEDTEITGTREEEEDCVTSAMKRYKAASLVKKSVHFTGKAQRTVKQKSRLRSCGVSAATAARLLAGRKGGVKGIVPAPQFTTRQPKAAGRKLSELYRSCQQVYAKTPREARPCSQSSWKSVDNDTTTPSVPMEAMQRSGGKKMKKRTKKTGNVAGLSSSEQNLLSKPMCKKRRKRKKITSTPDRPSAASSSWIAKSSIEPLTERAADEASAKETRRYVNTKSPQEVKDGTDEGEFVPCKYRPSYCAPPRSVDDIGEAVPLCLHHKSRDHSRPKLSPPPSSVEQSLLKQREQSPIDKLSPLNLPMTPPASPNACPCNRKTEKILAAYQPTHAKPIGGRKLLKPTSPEFNTALGQDQSLDERLFPQTSVSTATGVHQCRQSVEQCRRKFSSYKDYHSDVTVTKDETIKSSIIRKCAPLLIACLIQFLVQYISI